VVIETVIKIYYPGSLPVTHMIHPKGDVVLMPGKNIRACTGIGDLIIRRL